jgi:hypothetical protein
MSPRNPADIVAFPASSAGHRLNGQVIRADGGLA